MGQEVLLEILFNARCLMQRSVFDNILIILNQNGKNLYRKSRSNAILEIFFKIQTFL